MKLTMKSANVTPAEQKAGPIERAAVGAYAMAAIRDTEPLVPYLNGPLRGSAHSESVPEKGRIIYGSASVPYARAQYYSHPHKRWPGTEMEWFPKAEAKHAGKWTHEAERAAKEAAGR